jgi:hypothetical protein
MDQPDDLRTERLSETLLRLTEGPEEGRLSLGDLVQGMAARAHPALLILFALPNTLPGIPGTSAVLGVPLIFLTLQQALGRDPWLPGIIARRSIGRKALRSVLTRALPWLRKGESYLRPRLLPLTGKLAERLIGLISVVLSLIIMLPIPFGNMIPALAIICFSLALMEKDGVWTLAGAVLAAASLLIASTVLWALLKAGIFLVIEAFG